MGVDIGPIIRSLTWREGFGPRASQSSTIVHDKVLAFDTWEIVEQCGTPGIPVFPLELGMGDPAVYKSAEKGDTFESSRSFLPETGVDASVGTVGHIVPLVEKGDISGTGDWMCPQM